MFFARTKYGCTVSLKFMVKKNIAGKLAIVIQSGNLVKTTEMNERGNHDVESTAIGQSCQSQTTYLLTFTNKILNNLLFQQIFIV